MESRQIAEPSAAVTPDELRAIDARYQPFPAFEIWLTVETGFDSWDHQMDILEGYRRTENSDALALAARGALQAAASDTGAIEGLYAPDRGFTITVMTEAAAWDTALRKKSADVQALLRAQLHAYELGLDAATQNMPISEAWIRRLHEVLCEPQDSYDVYVMSDDKVVREPRPLPKGEYKSLPNHVRLVDGSFHAYAPVAETVPEMHRLIEQISTDTFQTAHPVLQASYAHYALSAVHPFADGNGRVARVLASVYICRATSVPFVLFYEQKDAYLDALAAADSGRHASFVRFVADRSRQILRLVANQVRATPQDGLDRLSKLLVGASGLSHDELVDMATSLLARIFNEVQAQFAVLQLPRGVKYNVSLQPQSANYQISGYTESRKDGARAVYVTLSTSSPLAGTSGFFGAFVGSPDSDEPILLTFDDGSRRPERFPVTTDDVLPAESPLFHAALAAWVKAMLGILSKQLGDRVAEILNPPKIAL